MKRFLTILLVVAIALAGCAKLERSLGYGSVGRYQVVVSALADKGCNVFLLDSKTGSIWRLNDGDFVPVRVVNIEADTAKNPNTEINEKDSLEIPRLTAEVFVSSLKQKYGADWKTKMTDPEKEVAKALLKAREN